MRDPNVVPVRHGCYRNRRLVRGSVLDAEPIEQGLEAYSRNAWPEDRIVIYITLPLCPIEAAL